MSKDKLVNKECAYQLISSQGEEFAVIKNPDYIHPEFEVSPMAEKLFGVEEIIPAFVMDMDGTTTTTEVLCLHSLEYMIRSFCGKETTGQWAGLDHTHDYPHIIGNSTTRHVEYLINKYQNSFVKINIVSSFIRAALWTIVKGRDENRKEEVKNNIINLNLGEILSDVKLKEILLHPESFESSSLPAEEFVVKYGNRFNDLSFSSLVRAGIDVYYQRYHEILERIKKGEADRVSEEIFSHSNKHLIEPMPGVLFFLSLIKGWLVEDSVEYFLHSLIGDYRLKTKRNFELANDKDVLCLLKTLALKYENKPAKTALVTSSIFYEADIVMNELMKVLRENLDIIELPDTKKEFLKDRFGNYRNVYDAFVTASDSSEIRLKPHRDLYSIALHKLHIAKDNFNKVAGFEDSESGTIAIRTAGIGLCVALPFAQTKEHNLQAASYICEGGLPEVLLKHSLFIK